MKVNFSRVLRTLTGEPMIRKEQQRTKNENGEVETKEVDYEITLRDIAINALLTPNSVDKLSGAEKLKRYRMAEQINKSKAPVDLSVEQISLLKDLISKAYASPLVCGQAWEMLDPSSKENE